METKAERNNSLFYRFTAWLKLVLGRAKIDYIRHLKGRRRELPLDEPRITRALSYQPEVGIRKSELTFDFENEAIGRAVSELPEKRREVLEMLFVRDMSPEDIALKLGCTVQHVYNQRSLALKELRAKLKR